MVTTPTTLVERVTDAASTLVALSTRVEGAVKLGDWALASVLRDQLVAAVADIHSPLLDIRREAERHKTGRAPEVTWRKAAAVGSCNFCDRGREGYVYVISGTGTGPQLVVRICQACRDTVRRF